MRWRADPVTTAVSAERVVVTFRVNGTPQPKGSTRALIRKDGTPKIVSDNPRVKSWATAIAWAARAAGVRITDGPVTMTLAFAVYVPDRPPRHGQPTRKPDLDKLARAVLDALTGIAYVDDAQVVTLVASKAYACETPGVTISIER